MARRPAEALVGVVHNSPWLDMHGPFWMRTVGTAVVNRARVYNELDRWVSAYVER